LGLLLLATALDARVQPRPHHRKPAPARRAATATNSDPAVVNDPKVMDRIGPGAKGSAVVRAQILLDRAGFSSGEIDGNFGKNLQNTVAAFQNSRGLNEHGSIGPETWQALNADSAPAIQPYTIAHGDLAGPFEKIPADMMDRSKLPALGYESPVDGLAEKFHCAPKLLIAWTSAQSSLGSCGRIGS
jgi:peptidoglycan hydrolase-like protein with peptidoglycan-binding domain